MILLLLAEQLKPIELAYISDYIISWLAYLEFLLLWLINFTCILRLGFTYGSQNVLRIGMQLSIICSIYFHAAASASSSSSRSSD